MKKHAIIPIFIPHAGCPNDCVFCNQKVITARNQVASYNHVGEKIQEYLITLKDLNLETIEVAFFGGSFTGIPIEEQSAYLSIAKEYKDANKIDKIHLSTRPDYINEEILDNLKKYSVDIIELGVQSFDEETLRLSKRGHNVEDVYKACDLIKYYGFTLGIQLMIGLPGDTLEKAIKSAKETVALKPNIARLYPTIILPDTELSSMYQSGKYNPPSQDFMVNTTKEMYKILFNASINIIRVGLKSTDLVKEDSIVGGDFHPAFRQLVEGEIALEKMENLMARNVIFLANEKWFGNLIGHKACNKKLLMKKYPDYNIKYKVDNTLENGVIAVSYSDMVE